MSWLTSSLLSTASPSLSSSSFASTSPLDSSASSSSSSSGLPSDPSTADSSEYPQVFLLAIFLPSLCVGLAILYAHYSMRTYNQLRWPCTRTAAEQSRRKGKARGGEGSIEASGLSGPVNLVSALRLEMGAGAGADERGGSHTATAVAPHTAAGEEDGERGHRAAGSAAQRGGEALQERLLTSS